MWIMVFCECVRMHMFTKPTWEIRDIGKEERKIVDPGVLWADYALESMGGNSVCKLACMHPAHRGAPQMFVESVH